MTTPQPQQEGPCPESPSLPPGNWPPQYGQTSQRTPSTHFGRSPLFIPPPQFGRCADATARATAGRQAVPSQDRQAATSSPTHPAQPHGDQPELAIPVSYGRGTGTASFVINYVAPVIVLSLLLALGVIISSTVWRLVLAAAGCLALLSFGVWLPPGRDKRGNRRSRRQRHTVG
jgi:hypothetical protein